MSALYFRVQNMQGKGPFTSQQTGWIDTGLRPFPPPIVDEFPLDQLRVLPSDRFFGCAVRTLAGLHEWFTPSECGKLAMLDYYIAAMDGRVLAESKSQLLIARDRPFNHDCRVIPWMALSQERMLA